MAAYSNSLKALSSKPMENVRTGSAEASAMEATTELESIPPLKKAPNGTSAIIRMRTDSSNFSRKLRAGVGFGEIRGRLGHRRRKLPVAALADGSVRVVSEPGSRREACAPPETAPRFGNISEMKEKPQRLRDRSPLAHPPLAGISAHCRSTGLPATPRNKAASSRSDRVPEKSGAAAASQIA